MFIFRKTFLIKHILPATRLLERMHEENSIKLHVLVFLRMNTWMLETCRRQYNSIKLLMKKCAFCWFSYYIRISQCTGQKPCNFTLCYWLSNGLELLAYCISCYCQRWAIGQNMLKCLNGYVVRVRSLQCLRVREVERYFHVCTVRQTPYYRTNALVYNS